MICAESTSKSEGKISLTFLKLFLEYLRGPRSLRYCVTEDLNQILHNFFFRYLKKARMSGFEVSKRGGVKEDFYVIKLYLRNLVFYSFSKKK